MTNTAGTVGKIDHTFKTKEEILSAILTGVCEKAKITNLLAKSHLNLGKNQYVFALETKGCLAKYMADMLRKMWSRQKAYAFAFSNNITVFILDSMLVEETPDEFALMLSQLILDELYIECYIGFSSIVNSPDLLRLRFNEAIEAVRYIKNFKLKSKIANYNKMNLYRCLNSFPESVLNSVSQLYSQQWQQVAQDRELIITLEKYVESNLNLSEASRSLFIHRNTLTYRLGKIQKLTGLDYKSFDDMVLLRLLMLIDKALV